VISRRAVLKALAGSLLLAPTAGSPADEPISTPTLQAAASRGRWFLIDLFDPALGLLPEYWGARVYWLYHDNYLAAKALASTDPALAGKIMAAIQSHGAGKSGKIEILFGEARRSLPFRHYRLVDVRRVGDKLIRTEVAAEEVFQGWEEYADLRFLAAIASAQTDPKQARRHLQQGMRLWDGVGFRDLVAKKARKYAVYKVALGLLAASKLKVRSDQQAVLVGRLLKQQGEHGGWVTDYDEKGRPLGWANVETTSLAVLALDAGVPAADTPAPSFKITTRRDEDRVEVRQDKDRVVFDVQSPFGISQAAIERVDDVWPDVVLLRLHLKALSSFRASNGKVTLDAVVSVEEGKQKVRQWKDGREDTRLDEKSPLWTDIRIVGSDGRPARELPLKDGYFEMRLPRAFFEGRPKSITLNWIDFYRQ
jgi:hypothetical protein